MNSMLSIILHIPNCSLLEIFEWKLTLAPKMRSTLAQRSTFQCVCNTSVPLTFKPSFWSFPLWTFVKTVGLPIISSTFGLLDPDHGSGAHWQQHGPGWKWTNLLHKRCSSEAWCGSWNTFYREVISRALKRCYNRGVFVLFFFKWGPRRQGCATYNQWHQSTRINLLAWKHMD